MRSSVRSAAGLALREALTLAAVLVVVAVAAAAFVRPWLPAPPVGGDMLTRYSPVKDGDARLLLRTFADGSTRGWLAQNTRVVPGLRVYTDLRKSIADAVLEAARRPGETSIPDGELNSRLTSLTVVETRSYELEADGKVVEIWQYSVRDDGGDRFLGLYFPQNDRDVLASPPALVVPSAASPGDTWKTDGTLGAGTYTWDGSLVEFGPYDGPAGQYEDCLLVQGRLAIDVGGSVSENHSRDWFCTEVGWVEGQTLDPAGAVTERSVGLSVGGGLVAQATLPPIPPLAEATPEPAEPERWRMSRVGRVRATGETSESTIQPSWLPTDPPLVLAAGYESDLVAFDADNPGAPPRWRFHTDGTVYGQPAFDRVRGRVYFGSSDKRVYAVDTRGLFLWSFETGDNVAARPLIVDDLLVVGSEDGTVYGLDAATGRERWRFETSGGVVSSPALVGGVVAVGSDDRHVYGLDPATGEPRWRYVAGAAVEAPIVVDPSGGRLYVASRDGTIAAIDAPSCEEECDAAWSAEPGGALRNAPLVAEDRLILVDEEGELIALSTDEGKRLWALGGPRYVGAPALLGDAILVNTSRGMVERISLDGERLDRWDARTAMNPSDSEPAFAFGPVVGGDAVWLADTNAVVRRLGLPPVTEIGSLRLAWYGQVTRPPFGGNQMRTSAVEHQGRAVMVDFMRGVFAIDPATGNGAKLADLPGEAVASQIDPVVAGDSLLVVSGKTLQVFDLESRQLRWQGVGSGVTIRPPVVAGDTVLWMHGQEGGGALLAVGLADGSVRWQASLDSIAQVGGVVAGQDAAFTSTPPAAWDLASGAQRWQAAIPGTTIGGPALSPDGRTVYLTGVNPDGATGMVVAVDADTGAVRWNVSLGEVVVNPLDRLWAVDGVVVVPALEGKVVALDAETGAERWSFAAPVGRLGGITVDRGRVWLMLENARLYGLDLATGQPDLRFTEIDVNLNGQGLTQRPTFVGDRLVFPAGLIVLGFEVPAEGAPTPEAAPPAGAAP